MFACLFNELKYAVGLGGGLGLLFILVQMLAQVSAESECLKYVTPLTLFQPAEIITGDLPL